MMMATKAERFTRRRGRARKRIRRVSGDRCRLAVFCSSKNVYAQVIDDRRGATVAAASTLERDLELAGCCTVESAGRIGGLIAERALKAGVGAVVFDRSGYRYHGRVRALAEAARAGGLDF